MIHIWTSRFHNKPGDPAFCRASVYSRESGQILAHSHQCTRKPIVCRAVDGKEYGFCKQHDPIAVEERNKARNDAWRAEWKAKEVQERRRKQTAAAMDACKSAIEQIAAGHNDPRTLAVEALQLFPASHVGDCVNITELGRSELSEQLTKGEG